MKHHISPQQIQKQLQVIDSKLTHLELKGRELEDAIRNGRHDYTEVYCVIDRSIYMKSYVHKRALERATYLENYVHGSIGLQNYVHGTAIERSIGLQNYVHGIAIERSICLQNYVHGRAHI